MRIYTLYVYIRIYMFITATARVLNVIINNYNNIRTSLLSYIAIYNHDGKNSDIHDYEY